MDPMASRARGAVPGMWAAGFCSFCRAAALQNPTAHTCTLWSRHAVADEARGRPGLSITAWVLGTTRGRGHQCWGGGEHRAGWQPAVPVGAQVLPHNSFYLCQQSPAACLGHPGRMQEDAMLCAELLHGATATCCSQPCRAWHALSFSSCLSLHCPAEVMLLSAELTRVCRKNHSTPAVLPARKGDSKGRDTPTCCGQGSGAGELHPSALPAMQLRGPALCSTAQAH